MNTSHLLSSAVRLDRKVCYRSARLDGSLMSQGAPSLALPTGDDDDAMSVGTEKALLYLDLMH